MRSEEEDQYNESEDGEESSRNYSEYVTTKPIKPETFTHITLNAKSYNKTISYLKEQISINTSIQASLEKIHISSSVQTDEDDPLKSSSSPHDHSQHSTGDIERITIDLLQSTNKEIEIKELRELVKQLKEDNKSLKKKFESFNELHTSTVSKYKAEIEAMTKEIKELKEKELDSRNKERFMRYIIDIISNKTTSQSITQFLTFDDTLSLAKTHRILWDKMYYKMKSEAVMEKLSNQKTMMEALVKMDTCEYYEITESELTDIITSYVVNNKHSASQLRTQIVNSLIFLEKNVKEPMKNYSSPDEPPVKVETSKKGMFFNKINSVFTSMIKGDDQSSDSFFNTQASASNTPSIPISFPKDDFKNLFVADKHILETYNTNKSVNVVFQYSKAEQIKDLIGKFFDSKLPKPTYQSFISTIIDKFSELLYACYDASIDIKNLEILKHALDCRVRKYRLENEELTTEINDLKQFAQSSREIKEMLLKTKNECEIKYNNALMVIQQLHEEKIAKDNLLQEMTEKIEKSKNDYDEKKKQMIKDFKAIQGDYSHTKSDRDYLKGTIIDFKNYFLKMISEDGDLICS